VKRYRRDISVAAKIIMREVATDKTAISKENFIHVCAAKAYFFQIAFNELRAKH